MYFEYTVQLVPQCGDETSKCVFITSTSYVGGSIGSLDGGDRICQLRPTLEEVKALLAEDRGLTEALGAATG